MRRYSPGKVIRSKGRKSARRSTSQIGMQKGIRAHSLSAFHCHGGRRQDCAQGDPKDSELPMVRVRMKCFWPRHQGRRCQKALLPASACLVSPPECTPPPLWTTEEKNNLQKWGVVFKPSWAHQRRGSVLIPGKMRLKAGVANMNPLHRCFCWSSHIVKLGLQPE